MNSVACTIRPQSHHHSDKTLRQTQRKKTLSNKYMLVTRYVCMYNTLWWITQLVLAFCRVGFILLIRVMAHSNRSILRILVYGKNWFRNIQFCADESDFYGYDCSRNTRTTCNTLTCDGKLVLNTFASTIARTLIHKSFKSFNINKL